MIQNKTDDQEIELRSQLTSFSSPETSPDKRLYQIQQDLVKVAAWGNSLEAKQIDRELRQMYNELVSIDQPVEKHSSQNEESRNSGMVHPAPIDKPYGRTNSLEIFLKAFGLSVIPVFVGFGIALSISLSFPAFISYFVFSIGHWAGLAVFFRIAAPGVRFKLVKDSIIDGSVKKAGRWLGAYGGFEFGLGCFLTSIGLFLLLGNTVGMIFFLLAIILSPIIGILMGISVARQPER